jgi:hypothetical protein
LKKHLSGISARNPKFLARDNKICVSALRYTGRRPRSKLALPEPACHETSYCSGFQSFGLLVYSVSRCGRFFGFDDELSPLRKSPPLALPFARILDIFSKRRTVPGWRRSADRACLLLDSLRRNLRGANLAAGDQGRRQDKLLPRMRQPANRRLSTRPPQAPQRSAAVCTGASHSAFA